MHRNSFRSASLISWTALDPPLESFSPDIAANTRPPPSVASAVLGRSALVGTYGFPKHRESVPVPALNNEARPAVIRTSEGANRRGLPPWSKSVRPRRSHSTKGPPGTHAESTVAHRWGRGRAPGPNGRTRMVPTSASNSGVGRVAGTHIPTPNPRPDRGCGYHLPPQPRTWTRDWYPHPAPNPRPGRVTGTHIPPPTPDLVADVGTTHCP